MLPLSVLTFLVAIFVNPEAVNILLSALTVFGSVGTSLAVNYAWIRSKFAANDVEITNIKQRIEEHCAMDLREQSILSRELMSMRQENSSENARIEKLVTDIRINIASHDGILKNLEDLIKFIRQ